jgi:hypothetical protein
MSRISSCIIAVLTAAFAGSALASADVPPPGAHGVVKRLANVPATFENFSPLQFDARPTALTSDRRGGVWFGLGNTLEHIDRASRVTRVTLPWLWDIGGMSYDGRGRLWFSLGQSGRIGTLVDGQLVTRVLVPRHDFPDIRGIAFDRIGALWFLDVGRRSIGRRAADGVVAERPLGDRHSPVAFAFCRGVANIATVDGIHGGGEIVSFGTDLNASTVQAWAGAGRPSVACDRRTKLRFSYASFHNTSYRGESDARSTVQSVSPVEDNERLFEAEDGAVLSVGQQYVIKGFGEDRRLRIERLGDDRPFTMTLPFQDANTVTQTGDGTLWIGLSAPQSIVRVRLDR